MNTIFITEIEVTDEQFESLLTSGLEGGCNHWLTGNSNDIREESKKFYNKELNVQNQIMLGGSLNCYDLEMPDSFLGTLTLDKVKKALKAMSEGKDLKGKENKHLKWHFKNFINENDDAETADVVIQIAVMEEIVFG